jgi:hypothetical protein
VFLALPRPLVFPPIIFCICCSSLYKRMCLAPCVIDTRGAPSDSLAKDAELEQHKTALSSSAKSYGPLKQLRKTLAAHGGTQGGAHGGWPLGSPGSANCNDGRNLSEAQRGNGSIVVLKGCRGSPQRFLCSCYCFRRRRRQTPTTTTTRRSRRQHRKKTMTEGKSGKSRFSRALLVQCLL